MTTRCRAVCLNRIKHDLFDHRIVLLAKAFRKRHRSPSLPLRFLARKNPLVSSFVVYFMVKNVGYVNVSYNISYLSLHDNRPFTAVTGVRVP